MIAKILSSNTFTCVKKYKKVNIHFYISSRATLKDISRLHMIGQQKGPLVGKDSPLQLLTRLVNQYVREKCHSTLVPLKDQKQVSSNRRRGLDNTTVEPGAAKSYAYNDAGFPSPD